MASISDTLSQRPIYVHTTDGMHIRSLIEDLSCNNIIVGQAPETGSAYIVSIPNGAKIYIDNIEQAGVTTPATINNIPSAPFEHTYKLVKSGYVDIEGLLFITTGQTYNVTVTMCKASGDGWPLLIGVVAIGMLLSRGNKEEKGKYEQILR